MPANTDQLPIGLIAGRGRTLSTAVNVNTSGTTASAASPIPQSPTSATAANAGVGLAISGLPGTAATATTPPTATTANSSAQLPNTNAGGNYFEPYSPSSASHAQARSPAFSPHFQQAPHTQGQAPGQSPLLSYGQAQSLQPTGSTTGSPIVGPAATAPSPTTSTARSPTTASTAADSNTTARLPPNPAASVSSESVFRSPPRINTNTPHQHSSDSPSSAPASGITGPFSADNSSIHSTGHGQGQAIANAYCLSPLTPPTATNPSGRSNSVNANGPGNINTTTLEWASIPSASRAYQAYSPGYGGVEVDPFFSSASAGAVPDACSSANGGSQVYSSKRPWGSFSTEPGTSTASATGKDHGVMKGRKDELGFPFLTGGNAGGTSPGATTPTPSSPGPPSSSSGYNNNPSTTSTTHSGSYDSYRSKQSSLREREHTQAYSPSAASASARLGLTSPSPLGISGQGVTPSSFQTPFPRSTSPAPMNSAGPSATGSGTAISPGLPQQPHDYSPILRTQSPASMHRQQPRLGTPTSAQDQSLAAPVPQNTNPRRPGTAASSSGINSANANAVAMATTSATAAPMTAPTPVWETTHPHAHGIHGQAQALALQTQGLSSRPSSSTPGGQSRIESLPNSASPSTPAGGYGSLPYRKAGPGSAGASAGLSTKGEAMPMGKPSPGTAKWPGPGAGPPPGGDSSGRGPGSSTASPIVHNWLGAPGPIFRERDDDGPEEVPDDEDHRERAPIEETNARTKRQSKRDSAPPITSISAAVAMLRRESPTRSQSGPVTTVKQIEEERQKGRDMQQTRDNVSERGRDRDRSSPVAESQQQQLLIAQKQAQTRPPMKGQLETTTATGTMALSQHLTGEEGEILRTQSRSPSRKPPSHGQKSGQDGGAGAGSADPHQARSARTENSYQSSKPRSQSKRNTKSPGSTHRICRKCGQGLQGQFVRALDKTYHLECFQCHDCGEIVASKFFTMNIPEEDNAQFPLCEKDYFRRLDLLCYSCNGALRGSYITALNHKYHIEHFTCTTCPTVFGAQDSYYEYKDRVYCHYHYFTKFAQRCNGCQSAILKQFVEIFRNGQNQHWHPECYMIHKFWNVRLAAASAPPAYRDKERARIEDAEHDTTEGEDGEKGPQTETDREGRTEGQPGTDVDDVNVSDEQRRIVREQEDAMEKKVFTIWSTLSTFEESSAACISDMLLHVSNGSFVDGVVVAKRFIYHVDLLFQALDGLNKSVIDTGLKEISYGREAKLLCKKVVAFFSLLSKSSEQGVRKLGVTPDLLKLVTGLAHYLKLLIRIGLQGALRFEREFSDPTKLYTFLETIDHLVPANDINSRDLLGMISGLSEKQSDRCTSCFAPVDDECILLGSGPRRWHINPQHFVCGKCNKDLSRDLENALWSERDEQLYCRNCLEALDNHDALLNCQSNFTYVTRLQQYVYLLQVALARLLAVLRASGCLPHPADDINVRDHDADSENVAFGPEPPRRSNTMHSKTSQSNQQSMPSTAYTTGQEGSSSLEQTVGEIKRLHSKRTERTQRTLSTTFKTARASRIIDGPKGRSARPGSPSADSMAGSGPENFQIVEERAAGPSAYDQTKQRNDNVFQDTFNLDDIHRIVAAERANQRKAGSGDLGDISGTVGGHNRDVSVWDMQGSVDAPPGQRPKYFFELSSSEYYVARHMAVMQMYPLLEGQMTLEELVALIEPRKVATIWNFFGRAFKNDRSKATKKKGVFGVPLETLVEKDGTESTHGILGSAALKVPTFVDDVVSAMRQMDMSVEGVFRKNGNIKKLKDASELIDTRYESLDLNRETPVQVAALLKKFLREMPEPLLTYKLYKLFLASQNLSDPDKKRHVLHLTCCLLPKPYRDTTEVLFNFLNWAASFSQIDEESGSKMDVHNLATVIAPGVLRPDDGKVPAGTANAAYTTGKNVSVSDGLLAIEAVSSLIEFVDTMAEVPADIAHILNDKTIMSTAASMTSAEIIKKYGATGGLLKSTSHVAQNPGLPSVPENDQKDRDAVTGDGQPIQSVPRNFKEDMPTPPPKSVVKGSSESSGDHHGPKSVHRAQPPPTRDDRRARVDEPGSSSMDQSQGSVGSSPNGPPLGPRQPHPQAPAHVHNFSHPNPHGPNSGGGRSYAAYQPYMPGGPNAPPAGKGQRPKISPHPQSVSTTALPKASHSRDRERDQGVTKGAGEPTDERYQKQRGPSGSRNRRPGTSSSHQNGTASDREGPDASATS